MEPVFMVLAQSASIAIALAHANNQSAVQTVAYPELKRRLEGVNQVVSWDPTRLNGLTGNPELQARPPGLLV
jgi:hypothetical protein